MGSARAPPPRTGAWLAPKSVPPHMCCHVKFSSSASMGVCINRTEPPNWERWGPAPCGRGVADPLEIRPSPTCYAAKFGRSMSNGTSVIKEIRQKNFIPRVPPFKVTHGHRNRHGLIRHLWLPINVPQKPWAYLVPFAR